MAWIATTVPTTAPATRPTSRPTTAPSVTLIPETRPRKDKTYFSSVWITAYHELGIITPVDATWGTDTANNHDWWFECYNVGPGHVAVAMYDREVHSSLILLFAAPAKPGILSLSTDDRTLQPFLVRHHLLTKAEEDIDSDDPPPQKVWIEILQETAEQRAKDPRCFPLMGKAKLELGAGDFATGGTFELQSNGPLPPFQEYADWQIRFQREMDKDNLKAHRMTQKEYDADMAFMDKWKTVKAVNPCTLQGKLDHFYVKFPLPVMP